MDSHRSDSAPPSSGHAPRAVILGEVLFDHFPDDTRVMGGAPFNVAWHLCGFGADPLLEADPRWYEKYDGTAWFDEAWRDPWVFADPGGDGWHMLITARAGGGLLVAAPHHPSGCGRCRSEWPRRRVEPARDRPQRATDNRRAVDNSATCG